jgi:hypothetical protein
MPGLVLLAEGEGVGAGIGFAGLCISVAAYLVALEWRKARRAQNETDLKRDMIQKGLPAEEIDRILKATARPFE